MLPMAALGAAQSLGGMAEGGGGPSSASSTRGNITGPIVNMGSGAMLQSMTTEKMMVVGLTVLAVAALAVIALKQRKG